MYKVVVDAVGIPPKKIWNVERDGHIVLPLNDAESAKDFAEAMNMARKNRGADSA